MGEPELYGKPLRRSLKGYRKLRVGDYRVIFRIEKHFIKIFVIQHRSKNTYQLAEDLKERRKEFESGKGKALRSLKDLR